MWKTEACFLFAVIYMSTLIVCVRVRVCYICHSNLKRLTLSKYFAVVDIQTIYLGQYAGVFIVDVLIYLFPYLQLY